MSEIDAGRGVVIVYDGECPFCSQYVRMLRLRETFGDVRLVNARSDDPMAAHARTLFDLDDGMAARVGGEWYHGADCMHILALASGESHVASRLIAYTFARRSRARVLYPMLRSGRNLALRLMGRDRIGAARSSG